MSSPFDGSKHSFLAKGGAWVVAQFIVMPAWLVLTPFYGRLTDSIWRQALAGVLLAAGATLGILGVRALGRQRTPFPKPRDKAQLVQNGIYGVVRHPLYTSLIALSFGWACLWSSALGTVLALVQALLLNAKARREEMWLRKLFPEYASYSERVSRLIPIPRGNTEARERRNRE